MPVKNIHGIVAMEVHETALMLQQDRVALDSAAFHFEDNVGRPPLGGDDDHPGRPFEQLQDAGMRTAKLDEIVRQKDPEVKQVVNDLAHGRVREAVSELDRQGRVHEIPDRSQRFEAIAKDYAESSGRTLVVAPDNQSRRELNEHIRQELKDRGVVGRDDHKATVLVPRQDMTGADRAWAAQYREGDVIRYTRGSHQLGVKPASTRRCVRSMRERTR